MNIWLIKDSEVLPLDPSNSRMRNGMLAAELCRRGHQVTWWASTFSHQLKKPLFDRDVVVSVEPRLDLRLLHGGSYRRNISVRRAVHHWRVGRRFAAIAATLPAPDVVVTSLPTIDLAYEGARYAKERGLPLVMDVRDPWPYSLVNRCPRPLQGLARGILAPEYRRAAAALSEPAVLVGVTSGCLEWALKQAGRQRGHDDTVFFNARHPNAPTAPPTPGTAALLEQMRGKVVFTYVGMFGHQQLGLVADVAGDLERRGVSGVHFVIAGQGHQAAELHRRAAGRPNLTVTSWLNASDLGHVLAASSVGLVPSVSIPEAVGNKVFDYLAAGLPILTSLHGETGDLITEHEIGYLYPAGDQDALRECVLRMLDPATRTPMAARSRQLFEKRFRADRTYAAYADLVERLADRAAARRAS